MDFDLAALYGVETRTLKQAVKSNRARFPGDFLFVLTKSEVDALVSQSVIPGRGKFSVVFDAIKALVAEDEERKSRPKREIGFHAIRR